MRSMCSVLAGVLAAGLWVAPPQPTPRPVPPPVVTCSEAFVCNVLHTMLDIYDEDGRAVAVQWGRDQLAQAGCYGPYTGECR